MISKNHPHTPTHIHTCTHSLIHMCTHIHTPTHMPYTYTCTHTHTLTQVHTHTHTPACTCTPTHMCTYLYAQIFNKLHFLWTLTWFFSESFHNSPPIICWSKKKKSSPSTWVVALCAVCKRQITETVVMGGGGRPDQPLRWQIRETQCLRREQVRRGLVTLTQPWQRRAQDSISTESRSKEIPLISFMVSRAFPVHAKWNSLNARSPRGPPNGFPEWKIYIKPVRPLISFHLLTQFMSFVSVSSVPNWRIFTQLLLNKIYWKFRKTGETLTELNDIFPL